MHSPNTSVHDGHELKFALSEEDSWALIKALDHAFPGSPGRPAPGWLRAIFILLKWAISTLPLSLLCAIVLLISFSDTPIRMWQVLLVAVLALVAGVSSSLMLPERNLHPFVRVFIGLGRQRTMVLSRNGVRAHVEIYAWSPEWKARHRL